MFRRSLLLLSISIILIGCAKFREKRKATVTINFQTELNQAAYNMLDPFTDAAGRGIRIELIKFYLSNVVFVAASGEEIEVEDIALVELNSNGQGTFETKISADDYTSIKFGIGVPKTLNESDPSSFTEENHPLSTLQNTYWGMNGMYRFVMVDGRYDDNNDAIFDGTFSYHSGHDGSYRTVSFEKSMRFDKKESYTETIFIDISKILEGSGGNLDIIATPYYHGSLDDFYLSTQLSDNFSQAFRLK